MSDFVYWCRHLLVPFFFMNDIDPYIPLHFIEMIFPLVILGIPISFVVESLT